MKIAPSLSIKRWRERAKLRPQRVDGRILEHRAPHNGWGSNLDATNDQRAALDGLPRRDRCQFNYGVGCRLERDRRAHDRWRTNLEKRIDCRNDGRLFRVRGIPRRRDRVGGGGPRHL